MYKNEKVFYNYIRGVINGKTAKHLPYTNFETWLFLWNSGHSELWCKIESRGDRPVFSAQTSCSDVGSYLKLGGQVVMWGAQNAPLAEIGLTDLSKSGWAISHPAHLSSTSPHGNWAKLAGAKYNTSWILIILLGTIFILRKDIGVGGWSRKWQFM